jgi:hypothetical protein
LIGAEAVADGCRGRGGVLHKLLDGRLEGGLRLLTSKPFQFIIAYEIIKKITHSNADLSNDAGGAGDVLPVYEDGKWVDPLDRQARRRPGVKAGTSGTAARPVARASLPRAPRPAAGDVAAASRAG